MAEDLQYQYDIEKATEITLPSSPQQKPGFALTNAGKKWKLKPGIAKGVLAKKGYSCEYDVGHQTFTSRIGRHNYVEAHHLVPMRLQEQFKDSLDVPGNIIALCPTCHRLVHHAISEEKARLLQYFYSERKHSLTKFDIHITIGDLLKAYME